MAETLPRSIIYIDGFNLYYRLLQGSGFSWLNLEKYFSMLRTAEDIQAIRYFTSPVQGRPDRSRGRQKTYLDALKTTPKVQVILGGFSSQPVTCRVRSCDNDHREYRILQEKKTDVAIGLHMLNDALHDRMDRAVLVSGDSDMIPALKMLKDERPNITTSVYVPSRNDEDEECYEVRRAADKDRNLPRQLLKKAQFPDTIDLPGGGKIKKPAFW